MFKPLPLFLGLRYSRSRRRNGFIAFISASSLIGIALGVMALILGLSAMNGFERELKNRVLSVVPHGELIGMEAPLPDWTMLRQAVNHDDVAIAVTDRAGRLVCANDLFATWMGGFVTPPGLPLEGRHSDELMSRLLASGRAHFGSLAGPALGLGEQAILLAMPAALAASWGFILPAGTGPNAIAWSTGHIRIGRLVRAGILLDVAGLFLIVGAVWTVASFA